MTPLLVDLFGLALWLAVIVGAVSMVKRRQYLGSVPLFAISAVGAIAVTRGGEKLLVMRELKALQAVDIQAVELGGAVVSADGSQHILSALNGVSWATSEHACQAEPVLLRLHKRSGGVREVWLAANPCASGVTVNLSNPRASGVFHGALFSRELHTELAAAGLSLPGR